MNSLLARSFVAFVAALVTWAGAPSSMAGAIPSSATSTSSVYTYDGQHPVAGPTLAGPDRGPPTNEPVSSSSSVGRLGSKAASAHQYAAVTLASHDYPDLAPFTRAASRGGAAVQASRTACPVGGERLGVAAKAVPEAVEAGGGAARAPSFIVKPNGETVIVPEGASGPFPTRGDGFQFTGGAGGHGLDSSVSSVRIMDPVTTGKYTYPNGYASYSNGAGQTVNPFTGQTVGRSSEWWHWAFGQ